MYFLNLLNKILKNQIEVKKKIKLGSSKDECFTFQIKSMLREFYYLLNYKTRFLNFLLILKYKC